MLRGRESILYTDHKPLSNESKARVNKYSHREVVQLYYISRFTSDIRHVKGQDNRVINASSRLEMNTLQQSIVKSEDFGDNQKEEQ